MGRRHVSTNAGRLELAFNTAVAAADEGEALRIVQDEVLPRVLAAISAVADCPIYGVVIAAHVVAPLEVNVDWISDSPTSRLFYWAAPPPARLPDEPLVEKAPGLLWAATHDGVARRAAYDLHAANLGIYSRTAETADAQSILTAYYFVLERITNHLSRLHPQPSPTAESVPHLQWLEEQLEERSSVQAKLEAVKAASTKLAELHTRSMKRRVVDAGNLLGLSSTTIREGGKFTTLRHTRLAHASKLGSRSPELDDWLPRAQRCAIEYLSGYLRWVAVRGQSIPERRA